MKAYCDGKEHKGKFPYHRFPEICYRKIIFERDNYLWTQTFFNICKHYDIEIGEAIEIVVEVFNYGFEKYKVENSWQNVEDGQNLYFAAFIRHNKFGDDEIDEESGLPHWHMALCNATILIWYELKESK